MYIVQCSLKLILDETLPVLGTGACAVYPLLGARELGWSILGTEVIFSISWSARRCPWNFRTTQI